VHRRLDRLTAAGRCREPVQNQRDLLAWRPV